LAVSAKTAGKARRIRNLRSLKLTKDWQETANAQVHAFMKNHIDDKYKVYCAKSARSFGEAGATLGLALLSAE
jgi:rhodanese-related sulfurtransferase